MTTLEFQIGGNTSVEFIVPLCSGQCTGDQMHLFFPVCEKKQPGICYGENSSAVCGADLDLHGTDQPDDGILQVRAPETERRSG